uniref:PAP-associated domain-containing protein n=1 Tax=Panagrolaimus sp. ES5 TaxID=591445 RepID=A0AC34FSL7_9BILA
MKVIEYSDEEADSFADDSYDPLFLVKGVEQSVDDMKEIANLRKKDVEMFVKLDSDLLAFGNSYNFNSFEMSSIVDAKKEAFDQIADVIPKYPDSDLYLIGSSKSGLGDLNLVIDLCWVIPDPVYLPSNYLGIAKKKLMDNLVCLKDDEVRAIKTRIPFLSFKVLVRGYCFSVNLSVNNTNAIYNTHLLYHYAKFDKRLAPLVKFLTYWGKKIGIINSFDGFLNRYTVTLMVVHYFQCGVSPPILPNLIFLYPEYFYGDGDVSELDYEVEFDGKVFEDRMGLTVEKNYAPLGDLLIGFFWYFKNFQFDSHGIYFKMACCGEKKTSDKFFIEDIYDDFSACRISSLDKLERIKSAFHQAASVLSAEPVLKNLLDMEKSIL